MLWTVSTLVMALAVVLMPIDASPQQQPLYSQQQPSSFYYSPSPSPSYFSSYYYPNYYRNYPLQRPSYSYRNYNNYYYPSFWQQYQQQQQQQPFYDSYQQPILPYSYKPYSPFAAAGAAVEQRSDSLSSEPEAPIEGAVIVPANVNGAFGGSLSVFEASQLASGSQLEELDPTFYPLVGLRPNNPFELAQPRPTVRDGPSSYFYPANRHPSYYYNYL